MPYWSKKQMDDLRKKFLDERIEKDKIDFKNLPEQKKKSIYKEIDKKMLDFFSATASAPADIKIAQSYIKFMQKKLKEQYKGKVKSPFQLEKPEQKKFFKIVKEEWAKQKTAKKDNDVFEKVFDKEFKELVKKVKEQVEKLKK